MSHMVHRLGGSWVIWFMGLVGRGLHGLWVTWVIGQLCNWSHESCVPWVMSYMGHGLRGS